MYNSSLLELWKWKSATETHQKIKKRKSKAHLHWENCGNRYLCITNIHVFELECLIWVPHWFAVMQTQKNYLQYTLMLGEIGAFLLCLKKKENKTSDLWRKLPSQKDKKILFWEEWNLRARFIMNWLLFYSNFKPTELQVISWILPITISALVNFLTVFLSSVTI